MKLTVSAVVDALLSIASSSVAGIVIPRPDKLAAILLGVTGLTAMGAAMKSFGTNMQQAAQVPWDNIPIGSMINVMMGVIQNAGSFDRSMIEKGKENLNIAIDALKRATDITSIFKSIDVANWDIQKAILWDLGTAPVYMIQKITEIYNQSSKGIDVILQKLNDPNGIIGAIQKLAWTQVGLIKSLGGDQEVSILSNVATDFSNFVKITSKSFLSKEKTDALTTLIGLFEKLAWIADPFDRFTKSFANFGQSTKDLVQEINKMDLIKFQEYNKFQSSSLELVKSDTSSLDAKIQQLKSMISQVSGTVSNPQAASGGGNIDISGIISRLDTINGWTMGTNNWCAKIYDGVNDTNGLLMNHGKKLDRQIADKLKG